MSSLSNAETLMTQQSSGNPFASRGLKYRVRIATEPDMVIVCETFAGIQTARCGGTTPGPSQERNVINPREGKTTWCLSWESNRMRWATGSSPSREVHADFP